MTKNETPKGATVFNKLIGFYFAVGVSLSVISASGSVPTEPPPDNTNDWLAIGRRYEQSNDPVNAEIAYHNAVVSSGDCYNSLWQLARLLYDVPGRAQDAECYARVCSQLEPQKVKPLFLLASIMRHRKGPFDEIEHLYQQAISNSPNFALTYSELGTFYLERNYLDRAERELCKAVELAPKDPDLHMNYGVVLTQLPNKQAAAEKEFRQVLQVETNSAAPAKYLAYVLSVQEGRETEAEKWARESIKLKPENSESYRVLADILSHNPKKWKDAEQQYRKSIELDAGDPETLLRLGDLLARDPKRASESKAIWSESLRLYQTKTNWVDQPLLFFGVKAQDRIKYLQERLKE